MLKIEEIDQEYEVDGVLVNTPQGFVDVLKVYKTIPMKAVHIYTCDYDLICSEGHVLYSWNGPVAAGDLKVGNTIETETGKQIITYIERLDNRVLYDITVDHPSGLFYSGGILSHNSTTFCARLLIYAKLFPGYKSLLVTPYDSQRSTYGDRLKAMEQAVRYGTGKQNKYTKMYPNGSEIRLQYALESADRIRGISTQEVLIDECLAADTTIVCRTEKDGLDRKVKICDAVVGDYVQTFDDTGNLVYGEITDKQYKGVRECWELVTASGKYIIATNNHKMATPSGTWVYVADIASGEYNELCCLADNRKHTDTVVSILKHGMLPVWDITVDSYNSFIANELHVHNCQNMSPDLVPEILKTQSQSKLPMTIYSGTALDTSTLLEKMWQASSFGCYHVRSHDGKHWINMHDEEELWKVCDNPSGPIDYYTNKPLDVTNGIFVHGNLKAYEAGDIGIHIPMPIVVSNCTGTQWAQIYKDMKQQDPKKTLQESFGIAIGDGAREISELDLIRICVLTDSREEAIKKCRTGYYSLVVMGCDWGGSDYNKANNTKLSYTAVTILGLAPDGCIDILWSKKYAGMDYRTIAGDFLQQYRAFGCNAIASDFGVGAVYNMIIRDHIPWQNHFVMQYSAPNTAPFAAAKNSQLANHYVINKTEAITNVFGSVKDMRLRASNWEDMSYYLTDFLNVSRVPYETPTGAKSLRWIRQADKADDYLHAVTFASTLIKVHTGERIVTDKSLLSQILDVLAGRPMFDPNHWEPPVISG